jgi:hypothetical protein
MKPLCQFVLREMGSPSSSICWMTEAPEKEPYQAVNDQLVEIFQRLLTQAATLTDPPAASWTEKILVRLVDELRQTLAHVKPEGIETHVGARRSC